jgi:hypothetical protein
MTGGGIFLIVLFSILGIAAIARVVSNIKQKKDKQA